MDTAEWHNDLFTVVVVSFVSILACLLHVCTAIEAPCSTETGFGNFMYTLPLLESAACVLSLNWSTRW